LAARRATLSRFAGEGVERHLNASSTGVCIASASRFVSAAMPTTPISSMNCASVIPFARAAAVCERMQYSQDWATETAM